MLKLSKITLPHTSIRLNVMVVCQMVLLLFLSLAVLFFFSRRALKEGAVRDAEQRQQANMQYKENLRQSVEQTASNIYQDILGHLDQPERMYLYSRKILETNPNIVGCAIVFKPHYYKDRELFMAYVHRNAGNPTTDENMGLVTQDTFTSRLYTEQVWYTKPMKTGSACWNDLLKSEENEGMPLSTFSLPIYDGNNECVGVVAADLSYRQDTKERYTEAEIFSAYKYLIFLVLAITVVGVLLFYVLCRLAIRRQMQPLILLTHSAQRIAEGHYGETIPDTPREDEIGQLQHNFQLMQQSLAARDKELQELTITLKERSEVLRKAYGQTQGSDRMKTTFLHYMTTQMIVPCDIIDTSVTKLSDNYNDISLKEFEYEADVIKKQSDVIIDLLDNMVEALKKEIETGKEVDHE